MTPEQLNEILLNMDNETFENFLNQLPEETRDIIRKQRFFLRMFNDESFYTAVQNEVKEMYINA